MSKFFSLQVVYKQTNLWLKTEEKADSLLVKDYLKQAYQDIEKYIDKDKNFLTTFHPCKVLSEAPDIIKKMSICSLQAGVGPMAGVAGAIADYLGQKLSDHHSQILCNNGGDIYYRMFKEQHFPLSAPGSPFHNKMEICAPYSKKGKGLCTSSGISGHSINLGRSFAVTILADSACLADVWATAVSNRIKSHLDIDQGLKNCRGQKGVEGVIILVDQYLAAWGEISLSRVD